MPRDDEPKGSEGGTFGALLKELAKPAGPAAASQPDLIGATLHQYRVLGVLGSGGMGVVYRAEDTRLGRQVALKVLPRTLSDDPERRRRFLREARSAAAIAHPNIATIYEVEEVDGRAFLVMELVEGETLHAKLRDGPLPIPEAVRIGKAIARGLAKAHEKGIIHRDLKPENVMVTREGDVKILDFGLAKLFANSSNDKELERLPTETAMTEEGVVLGTLAYMSPEQASGESLDARSDVFSLGVVLYEMVTGRRAFTGATRGDLLAAVLRDEPPAPSRRNARIGPSLELAIQRCLRKRPDERWASAEEVLAALEEGDSPVPSQLRGRRRRALAAAAGAVVAVAGLSFGVRRSTTHGPSLPSVPGSMSAAARPMPTAIDALAEPRTTSPEAAALYRSALQSLRNASVGLAEEKLQRAVQLDPAFAAAHVQILVTPLAGDNDMAGRSLSAATQARTLLSERDAALFETIRPDILVGAAPDPEASWSRWKALVERFPQDAEIVLLSSYAAHDANRKEAAEAAIDRAIALDPTFAWSYAVRADLRFDDNDLDGVLATVARCLEVSPSASSCVFRHSQVLQIRGRCGELEADARKMVTLEPDNFVSYRRLADALWDTWAPPEAIEDALRRAADLDVNPVWKTQSHLIADLVPPATKADFGGLMAILDPELERVHAHPTTDNYFFGLQGGEVFVLEEMGEYARAGDVARDFVRRTAGTTSRWGAGDRMVMLRAERRAHDVTEAEYRADRDRLFDEAKATEGIARAWLDVYAGGAESADDATEALEAQPRDAPLPSLDGAVGWDRDLGRTYLLAGRVDDAIATLRKGAAVCSGVDWGFMWRIQATEALGEALELKGDTDGACAAYGQVLLRWGHAKPRSVTADAARTHSKKLRCPP